MQIITIDRACAYLEASTIEETIDLGHCVVNHGRNEAGMRFTLIHDWQGHACVTESN